HTRTATTRPSSPDQAEPDPPHQGDTPPENDPDPSDQQRRAPSTPDAPPAATPSTTAASTTTARGHTQRILEPSRKSLKPGGRPRFSDSLSPRRSHDASRRDGESDRAARDRGPEALDRAEGSQDHGQVRLPHELDGRRRRASRSD